MLTITQCTLQQLFPYLQYNIILFKCVARLGLQVVLRASPTGDFVKT